MSTNPLEERVKKLGAEFEQHFYACKKTDPRITAIDAYIGWSTQKLAKLELIVDGLLAFIQHSPILAKEAQNVLQPGTAGSDKQGS